MPKRKLDDNSENGRSKRPRTEEIVGDLNHPLHAEILVHQDGQYPMENENLANLTRQLHSIKETFLASLGQNRDFASALSFNDMIIKCLDGLRRELLNYYLSLAGVSPIEQQSPISSDRFENHGFFSGNRDFSANSGNGSAPKLDPKS